jgi:putative nucleotidyltransferase with HDIG domain
MKPAGNVSRTSGKSVGIVTIEIDEFAETTGDMGKLCRIVRRIKDLPPLPLVARKILSLTKEEAPNMDELARVISNDEALGAKVLRIVNSPLYRVSSVVTSIRHAVALLGLRGVRDLALSLAAMGVLDDANENGAIPNNRLWEHSLGCAFCCKAVADRVRHRSSEGAFAAGLLHDIGKIVFNQTVPGSFREALIGVQLKGHPLVALEREEIGIPHTTAGELLLKQWNLPRALVEAVMRHHDPMLVNQADPPKIDIPLIIKVADILTRIACLGFGGELNVHTSDVDLLERLPLREEDLAEVTLEALKNVDETKGLLGIDDDPSSALSDRNAREPFRLAFFDDHGSGPLNPARLLLRRFSDLESFPLSENMKSAMDRTKPHLVCVDLSSEQSPGAISGFLRVCRNETTSPIVCLVSKRVSQETKEKAARAGISFLSTPLCPQALFFSLCDSGVNPDGRT